MPTPEELNDIRWGIAAADEETEVRSRTVRNSGTQIAPEQVWRSGLIIHNEGPNVLYLRWGEEDITLEDHGYSFPLKPGGRLEMDDRTYWEITNQPLRAKTKAEEETTVLVTSFRVMAPPRVRKLFTQLKDV